MRAARAGRSGLASRYQGKGGEFQGPPRPRGEKGENRRCCIWMELLSLLPLLLMADALKTIVRLEEERLEHEPHTLKI